MTLPTACPKPAEMLSVGSLFSGIGGLELGLEMTGRFRTVWQVEQSEYCRKVLARHWPDAQRFEDVRNVGKENLSPVDVICGGFPCQDVSVAGERAGIVRGNRSGLWHEYARIVRELRPEYVIVENVAGLLSDGMGIVLGDLAALGYDAGWTVLSACAVGAPHPRARVFILAHSYRLGLQGRFNSRPAQRTQTLSQAAVRWDVSAPFVCRGVDGIPERAQRLRALGNAVVPQCAKVVGDWLLEIDAALNQRGAA
jgi:DNA (cytosine-5)-methyltransferase 1